MPPLPIRLANLVFSVVFVSSLVYLMRRWRQKVRSLTPLNLISLPEAFAILGLAASVFYLFFSSFRIAIVQSYFSNNDDEEFIANDTKKNVNNIPTLHLLLESGSGDDICSEKIITEIDDVAAETTESDDVAIVDPVGVDGLAILADGGVSAKLRDFTLEDRERRGTKCVGGLWLDEENIENITTNDHLGGSVKLQNFREVRIVGELPSCVKSSENITNNIRLGYSVTSELPLGGKNKEDITNDNCSGGSGEIPNGRKVRIMGELPLDGKNRESIIYNYHLGGSFELPNGGQAGITGELPLSGKNRENITNGEDEAMVASVVAGYIPSYQLETKLGDCRRAAGVRREALRRITGRGMEGLPLDGFDYESILGQCCELPIGYVQIPVGIAGPLVLDGREYFVPMATTEGCLVASTNRGCKAIAECGGATSVLLKDGMTRSPVVKFPSVWRAAELIGFLEDPKNFEAVSLEFNRSSRFARLQSIKCAIAGRNLHMRFCCSTGDAMGMNMVSKGVQNVIEFLQADFPDMDVISISGNYCADKKPAAVNWIEGRGKSVVCEAVIKEEVVKNVLKTSVAALVELNTTKNLAGSAIAGALGGFNAHASNIVSAVFIATGQDPAQNVESSQCLTMVEATNDGKDLHISVTMPSVEVGTVGGGTQLASQAACLDLLGVKGASLESPGANARCLATIVAGAVLAGELSLLSALAANHLVRSHMKYNRSSKDLSQSSS